MSHDYGADARNQATAEGFRELTELVNELEDRNREIKEIEEKLKAAKSRQQILSEQAIPEMLESMNLREWPMADGRTVSIKTTLRHSLSKDRKPAAIEWLKEHEHGDIIKTHVSVRFSVGQEDEVKAAYEDAVKRFGSRAMREDDVHSSTLKSLLSNMLKEGKEFPMDLFGAFEQKTTVIV